ncbi:hypothetical protein EV182_003638, partial [Spiromyces aspiralis]
QDLDELTEEKWQLDDVTKKTNRFNYLWCRVHDELVWVVMDEIYDRSALRPYKEIRKIAIKRAVRILNVRKNTPKKDNEKKNMANRTTTQLRSNTISMPPRTPSSADYDKLVDKFEKILNQMMLLTLKELISLMPSIRKGLHESTANKKTYQISSDLPDTDEDEHIVGRIMVEIDPLGAFHRGRWFESIVGACYKSVREKVRPATTPLTGVLALTFLKTMVNIMGKKSTVEE